MERSTFVWFAAALVIVIVQFWQPIEGDLWNVTGAGMIALYAISLLGWLTVPVTSFFTDHFELFGLRQVFEYALERPTSKPEFRERAFYKKVRHPMMLGFLIGSWAAPHMTAGHLLFAGLMTSYILVGIYFEERDLARKHGQAYRDYQARAPKLLPFGGLRGAQAGPLKAKAVTAQHAALQACQQGRRGRVHVSPQRSSEWRRHGPQDPGILRGAGIHLGVASRSRGTLDVLFDRSSRTGLLAVLRQRD